MSVLGLSDCVYQTKMMVAATPIPKVLCGGHDYTMVLCNLCMIERILLNVFK